MSRRRPRRPTATSPASPDDASRPVEAAAAAMASANTTSFQVGVVPRCTPSNTVSSWSTSAAPRTMTSTWTAMSATAIWRKRRIHRAVTPMTLTAATKPMMASARRELDGPVAQLAPEGREVVRGRERGDRDQDHEVEQDGPAGHEAPQLVEGVAGEHGRAGALLVQRRALDVGHRAQDEEQRRQQEHDRGQAERLAGHRAEREVEAGADRRVDDREQRRRSERAAARSLRSVTAPPSRSQSRPAPTPHEQHAHDQPHGQRTAAPDQRRDDQPQADEHHQTRQQPVGRGAAGADRASREA